MKTNVPIETSNDALVVLANLIDGKVTKRRATRNDIIMLCQLHLAGLVQETSDSVITSSMKVVSESFVIPRPWNTPDEEDQLLLQGKSEQYIYGWNKVKHQSNPEGK